MANETEIRPAFTPEEWRERHADWDHSGQIQPYLIDGVLHFDCDDSHYARACTSHQRHQVAALALLGQPFGFTAEDVAYLRSCVGWLIVHGEVPLSSIAKLDSVRERIAALLPPTHSTSTT